MPLILIYLIALISGAMQASTLGTPLTITGYAPYLLDTVLLFVVGFWLSFTGLLHLFTGEAFARRLGMASGSPFQKVVGVCNVAMGATAFANLVMQDSGFRLAVAMSAAMFWMGAGLLHLADTRSLSAKSWNDKLTAGSEIAIALSLAAFAALSRVGQ